MGSRKNSNANPFSAEKIYVLASELLRVEPLPFAVHLEEVALYSMMPWKRRLDKATNYLKSAIKEGNTHEPRLKNIRWLDKAAAQKCKSMMPEILAKRSSQ